MKKYFTPCNIYTIAWLIYYLQELLLGSKGTVYTKVILICLIAISMYNFVLVNIRYKTPAYIKGLNVLLFIFTIYGIILLISGSELFIMENYAGKVQNFDYLKTLYISLLPIYSFYHFTIDGQLNSKNIKIWGIVLFTTSLLCFYQEQESYTQKLLMGLVTNEEFTNNAGYYIISAMPLIILYREKFFFQFALLLIAVVLVITSLKRGAILIGTITTIYIYLTVIRNSENNRKIWSILFSILFIIIGIFFTSYFFENSEYANIRIERTLDGDYSYRGKFFTHLWDIFIHESSNAQMFFGRGAWGTLTVNENYAHNDWLEILTNQGLFGIIIYAGYWLCLLKTIHKDITSNKERNLIILISFILFAKTFFSMSYSELSVITTLPMGYIFAGGKFDEDKQTIELEQ